LKKFPYYPGCTSCILDDVHVPNPGKGVCADPVNGVAILEGGGAGSPRWEQGASVEPR
jgi:hypothetical protein